MSDQIGHNKTCFVYRLYDEAGAMLYGGTTTGVQRRLQEHKMLKSWFPQVTSVEVDEYPSRWLAILAERHSGKGRYGNLPAGIGRGLAARMTEDELVMSLAHPTYKRVSAEAIARTWDMPIAEIRILMDLAEGSVMPDSAFSSRAHIDRMAVRRWLGKR